jgi:hypothetical protein
MSIALLPLKRSLAFWFAACLALPMAAQAQPHAEQDKQDFSAAERLLLMSNQLHMLKPPATLNYRFRKAGSLEENFTDTVALRLTRLPDGKCCQASGEFLTGKRQLALPEIEQPEGNPVILYFLEHDIRDMQRLTKGSARYFQKRIRMAFYEAAKVQDARFTWHGKTVAGKEITIRPYADDPNRAKFEQFIGKQYVFSLSDEVPGSVVAIRTEVATPGSSTPLIEEELLLADAAPPARAPAQTAAASVNKSP